MAQLTGSGPGHGINYVMVDDEQHLFTAGSITSMPAISAAADPATTKIGDIGLGSVSLVGGFDGVNVQSMRIENGSYLMIAGSITDMPSVSVTAGSESWIKGGSIHLYSGTSYIDIDNRVAGSIVNLPGDLGSVVISRTVDVSGTKLDKLIGSVTIGRVVEVSGAIFTGGDIVGSVVLTDTSSRLGISGNILGSVFWGGGVGSVMISGTLPKWLGAGSIVISGLQPVWTGVGSVVISGTSIPTWRGIGSVLLTQVGSVMISGTSNMNVSTGSIIVTDIRMPLFDLGSPGFKQLTQLISGTHADVWTPGPGSKIEIHGYEISAHTAQMVRLNVSGETAITTINRFRLPNSGTAIKTFVHPITPGDADQTIGVGTTATGSVDVTIYGRDKE